MHGRQASTCGPSAPRNQAAEPGLRRIDVELAASLTVQFWAIGYGRVEGCWTSPVNIPTGANTPGHQEQRHAEPERRPMHHCRTAH
eukprot:scaffold54316_cov63-Phaeocystis_antarctica.AAC.1